MATTVAPRGISSSRPFSPKIQPSSNLAVKAKSIASGITDATMSHDEGWQFIQIGRFLERATLTASLLDVALRLGVQVRLSAPLEELVFFIVIPICGLLTYEAVGTVLKRLRGRDG